MDKADLLFIAILADHVRQRPGNWGTTDDEAVAEARSIYESHLGERADPVVTMKMISDARGWPPRADLADWVRGEAGRRGVTITTIISEALQAAKDKAER